MTPTDSILPEDAPKVTPEQQRRRDYVNGLRQLAAFVETHPELPLPVASNHNSFVADKATFAAIARTGGVRWEKDANGDYFWIRVTFDGGTSYEVNVQRTEVCRKVVTGTRIEPATPEHEVETYEWVCDEPLLAGAK